MKRSYDGAFLVPVNCYLLICASIYFYHHKIDINHWTLKYCIIKSKIKIGIVVGHLEMSPASGSLLSKEPASPSVLLYPPTAHSCLLARPLSLPCKNK